MKRITVEQPERCHLEENCLLGAFTQQWKWFDFQSSCIGCQKDAQLKVKLETSM